tara:strand:+ start:208 stop:483 length:276 start_codon:yes stop_codon:yes gene_type:complete
MKGEWHKNGHLNSLYLHDLAHKIPNAGNEYPGDTIALIAKQPSSFRKHLGMNFDFLATTDRYSIWQSLGLADQHNKVTSQRPNHDQYLPEL